MNVLGFMSWLDQLSWHFVYTLVCFGGGLWKVGRMLLLPPVVAGCRLQWKEFNDGGGT